MRCNACNVILTNPEATRRFRNSGTFVDLCNKCLHTIDDDIPTEEGQCAEDEDEYET